MKIYKDIVYSTNYCEHRKLDIFCPENHNGLTIMLIHGGGWLRGNKEQWQEVIDYLTQKGFICASVGYRLADDYKYPAQIEDVRIAMYFLQNKAEKYGINGKNIVAFGSSAGATLAVTLGMLDSKNALGKTAEILNADNKPSAIVAYYPVSTLRTDMKHWQGRDKPPDFIHAYLGVRESENDEIYKNASLLENSFDTFVPMLLIHGTNDKTVPLKQSEQLAEKLNKKGYETELLVVEGAEHAFAYRLQSDYQYNVLERAINYIKQKLK